MREGEGDGSLKSEAIARLLRARIEAVPQWLPVEGRSMWPTIRPPAQVLVAARRRPGRGEVWVFVAPDHAIVVHRCLRRAGDGFVFAGDGHGRPDPWTPTSRLVGRAIAVHDARGYRRLAECDRVVGLGRLTVRRLRNVGPGHRNGSWDS